MDSVLLTHLLCIIAPNFQWNIKALHVHHGISPYADAWADFCRTLCKRLNISLQIERVDIAPLRHDHGIEAAARKLRYAAFSKQSCDFVALAHHADDQVETILLQLLRGAGVKGVAAMPVLSKVEGPVLSRVDGAVLRSSVGKTPATVRPLLEVPRSQLLEYARLLKLEWIEDESNADARYPRNFLRHNVLPALEAHFPAYRETLARSAKNFAEAEALLDELAEQDMQGLANDLQLDVLNLRALSVSRAKNLLRYFLHKHHAPMPHAAQLDDMLHQLRDARDDAAVCIEFGEWQVRRYQDKVHVLRALGEFDPLIAVPWRGEVKLEWPPMSGHLSFTLAQGRGISLAKLQRAEVTLRLRSGGESLRPYPNSATRSLKNLLQEHRVPPWQRERLPMLYCGEDLVCVVGVAIHADYQAQPGEESVLVRFEYLEYDSSKFQVVVPKSLNHQGRET